MKKRIEESIAIATMIRVNSAKHLAKNGKVGITFDRHHINKICEALKNQELFGIIEEKSVNFAWIKQAMCEIMQANPNIDVEQGIEMCRLTYNGWLGDEVERHLTAEEMTKLYEGIY